MLKLFYDFNVLEPIKFYFNRLYIEASVVLHLALRS